MATFEKCDKCGKISPNEEGKYIGNKWFELVITLRKDINVYSDNRRLVLLCKECFSQTGIDTCNWEYYDR